MPSKTPDILTKITDARLSVIAADMDTTQRAYQSKNGKYWQGPPKTSVVDDPPGRNGHPKWSEAFGQVFPSNLTETEIEVHEYKSQAGRGWLLIATVTLGRKKYQKVIDVTGLAPQTAHDWSEI